MSFNTNSWPACLHVDVAEHAPQDDNQWKWDHRFSCAMEEAKRGQSERKPLLHQQWPSWYIQGKKEAAWWERNKIRKEAISREGKDSIEAASPGGAGEKHEERSTSPCKTGFNLTWHSDSFDWLKRWSQPHKAQEGKHMKGNNNIHLHQDLLLY